MAAYRQVEQTTGKRVPELAGGPELWAENTGAWDAWLFLHDLRAAHGAPLLMVEIEAYARVNGIWPAQLADKLRAIEMEWNKYLDSKRSDEAKD